VIGEQRVALERCMAAKHCAGKAIVMRWMVLVQSIGSVVRLHILLNILLNALLHEAREIACRDCTSGQHRRIVRLAG
jgi:hypothetical protein